MVVDDRHVPDKVRLVLFMRLTNDSACLHELLVARLGIHCHAATTHFAWAVRITPFRAGAGAGVHAASCT